MTAGGGAGTIARRAVGMLQLRRTDDGVLTVPYICLGLTKESRSTR